MGIIISELLNDVALIADGAGHDRWKVEHASTIFAPPEGSGDIPDATCAALG